MKLKTRLSKQLEVAQFEDGLDELENKLTNLLPKIEYLKDSKKEETELENFISKQNNISDSLKILLKEEIKKENVKEIDEKQRKI